jgi:hypothetical protein
VKLNAGRPGGTLVINAKDLVKTDAVNGRVTYNPASPETDVAGSTTRWSSRRSPARRASCGNSRGNLLYETRLRKGRRTCRRALSSRAISCHSRPLLSVSGVVGSVVFLGAFAAPAPPRLARVNIFGRERMAVLAMREITPIPRRPSLPGHVAHVGGLVSNPEMRRMYAARVIARMAYEHAAGDWPYAQHIADAVRKRCFAGSVSDDPVSGFVPRGLPLPTTRRCERDL